MCAGVQVTPQCPDQTVSPRHLSEQWPSSRHCHRSLQGCALQLPTLRCVLSPVRDCDIQEHGQDGAYSPICSNTGGRQQKSPPPRESYFHPVAVCLL